MAKNKKAKAGSKPSEGSEAVGPPTASSASDPVEPDETEETKAPKETLLDKSPLVSVETMAEWREAQLDEFYEILPNVQRDVNGPLQYFYKKAGRGKAFDGEFGPVFTRKALEGKQRNVKYLWDEKLIRRVDEDGKEINKCPELPAYRAQREAEKQQARRDQDMIEDREKRRVEAALDESRKADEAMSEGAARARERTKAKTDGK